MRPGGPDTRALVLGGGGVTGIAWTTGLLFGLEEGGVELGALDLVVGTSAGATVGAQLTSGVPLSDLFDRQVDPARQVAELQPHIGYVRLLLRFLPAFLARSDRRRFRQRIGRVAMGASTVDPRARHEVIGQRLPSHTWPTSPLTLAAIDAHSGEERWFDAGSGVELVDAVAASCAVPGVWPPVPIDGRHYYDGGLPSPDNATRAKGHGFVLIVSPMGGARSGGLVTRLLGEVAELEHGGSHVTVLTPDAESRAALGRRALDPALRPQAALAGRVQGQRLAPTLSAPWV